jgi:hypothetical protein
MQQSNGAEPQGEQQLPIEPVQQLVQQEERAVTEELSPAARMAQVIVPNVEIGIARRETPLIQPILTALIAEGIDPHHEYSWSRSMKPVESAADVSMRDAPSYNREGRIWEEGGGES